METLSNISKVAKQATSAVSSTASSIRQMTRTVMQEKDKLAGKLQGNLNYILHTKPIIERQKELIRELEDLTMLNDEVSYDKNSIIAYLGSHPDIIDKLQQIIVLQQLSMGREDELDGRQEEGAQIARNLPTSIYSYALILASIMIENEPDLTFGLSNVTEGEYTKYINDHPNMGHVEGASDDEEDMELAGGKYAKSRRRSRRQTNSKKKKMHKKRKRTMKLRKIQHRNRNRNRTRTRTRSYRRK